MQNSIKSVKKLLCVCVQKQSHPANSLIETYDLGKLYLCNSRIFSMNFEINIKLYQSKILNFKINFTFELQIYKIRKDKRQRNPNLCLVMHVK